MDPDREDRANIPSVIRSKLPNVATDLDRLIVASAHYYNPDRGLTPFAGGAPLLAQVDGERARHVYNSNPSESRRYLGRASHYLTDVSNPMHTGGESWQLASEVGLGGSSTLMKSVHAVYEEVVGEHWRHPPESKMFDFAHHLETPPPAISNGLHVHGHVDGWPGSPEALAEGMAQFSHQFLNQNFNSVVKQRDANQILKSNEVCGYTNSCLREAYARSVFLVQYTQGRFG
jgi:hypothetical protein